MFKPTNPKFDMLIASLKEDRDKKHNIDNEISELPFIFSEVDDLEKEIEEMECDISSLLNQKKGGSYYGRIICAYWVIDWRRSDVT